MATFIKKLKKTKLALTVFNIFFKFEHKDTYRSYFVKRQS